MDGWMHFLSFSQLPDLHPTFKYVTVLDNWNNKDFYIYSLVGMSLPCMQCYVLITLYLHVWILVIVFIYTHSKLNVLLEYRIICEQHCGGVVLPSVWVGSVSMVSLVVHCWPVVPLLQHPSSHLTPDCCCCFPLHSIGKCDTIEEFKDDIFIIITWTFVY